jgi:WD40 repeat protein
VIWVPGSLTIASASYDNSIKFWQQGNDDEWACIDTLTGHTSTVWDIRFTNDGRFLASCSDDQTIKIWVRNDEFEGKDFYLNICTLEGHHDRPIYSCSWSPDGNLLATVIW